MKRIRKALRSRSGRDWAVTKGYHFGLCIASPRSRQLTTIDGEHRVSAWDQRELGELLDLPGPVEHVHVSSDAGCYDEYVARAEGHPTAQALAIKNEAIELLQRTELSLLARYEEVCRRNADVPPMSAIEAFSEENVAEFRERALALLAPLLAQSRVTFGGEGSSHNRCECDLIFRFRLPAAVDMLSDRTWAEDFKSIAPTLGMSADWLGQEFTVFGETYKLIGYRRGRGRKALAKPFVFSVRGQDYLFCEGQAKNLLTIGGLMPPVYMTESPDPSNSLVQ